VTDSVVHKKTNGGQTVLFLDKAWLTWSRNAHTLQKRNCSSKFMHSPHTSSPRSF